MEDKAVIVDQYARDHLDMTADVDIEDDDPTYFPPHPQSPLARKYCQCEDQKTDVRLLAQDCMCHHCNKFCLRDQKKGSLCVCRVGYGEEQHHNMKNTP